MVVHELLRQRAAPGDAEYVDRVDVEPVEQPRGEARKPAQAVG